MFLGMVLSGIFFKKKEEKNCLSKAKLLMPLGMVLSGFF
jgi:hypothetical protein